MTALLILLLVVIAARLVARTEPVPLRLARQDAGASIVAGQSWMSLVESQTEARAQAHDAQANGR